MSEQALKFGENVVNKKDFDASKQAIDLDLVENSKILVSDKFKINDIAVNLLFVIHITM